MGRDRQQGAKNLVRHLHQPKSRLVKLIVGLDDGERTFHVTAALVDGLEARFQAAGRVVRREL